MSIKGVVYGSTKLLNERFRSTGVSIKILGNTRYMNSYKSATLKGSGIMNTPVLSSLEYVTNSETRMTASIHKINT